MSTDPYADANTFSFGDSPELAEELLALVLAGTKTATCGACAIFPKAAAPVRRSAGAMLCWTALADVRRSSKPLKSRSGVSMRSMKVSPTKKVKVPGRWQTGGNVKSFRGGHRRTPALRRLSEQGAPQDRRKCRWTFDGSTSADRARPWCRRSSPR